MTRWLPSLAALSGAWGVAAGAFAAHGASGAAADWLRIGATYQLIHAVAALATLGSTTSRVPAWAFVAGGWIFAGTLDAMALGAPHWLGAITPIGGSAFILGWLVLGWSVRPRR